jgi:hypothetical protein
MRKKLKNLTLLGLGGILVVSFQNCADQKELALLNSKVIESAGGVNSNPGGIGKVQDSEGAATINAKQSVQSMMSLLGLRVSDMSLGSVNTELNFRVDLLAPSNELNFVNSPSIIAMTSLAAALCNQAVAKEKKGPRDLFKFLDFGLGPSSFGQVGALNTYLLMADRFWMRKPTSEEVSLMSSVVEDYYATISNKNLAAETDKLALFICTGMLSVPESYVY